MSNGDPIKQLELQKAQRNIKKLRAAVVKHEKLYREGKPEIGDWEFDMLLEQLKSLEELYPEFSQDSPSQKVGDDRSGKFPTASHLEPMLSLENTYSKDDLWGFDAKLRRALGVDESLEYVLEPKIDGVAISVVYENGKLVRAVTRGNGQQGDLVTDNFLQIKGVSPTLCTDAALLELRGEVFLDYAQFEKINQQRTEEGQELYANPRNLAAGTLKLKDATAEVAQRGLQVIFYGLGAMEGTSPKPNHADVLNFIKDLGLPTHSWWCLASTQEEVWGAIEKLDSLRNELGYPTDGAVLKLNSRALQQEAGMTAKAPRWAFAYKYEPMRAITLLEDIVVQVGRTGVLTPVAHLKPVELSGSTVSRATLHNADEIERKDVRIGDTVVIEKAGEVIPAVIKVVLEKRPADSQPYSFPHECPECHEIAVRMEGEVAWRCVNEECPQRKHRALEHFSSRNAMDIDGLGEAVVEELVNFIKTPADLYTLKAGDLYEMAYFQSKAVEVKRGQEYKTLMVNNLLEAIERSKANDLWRLLHGLGIAQVGENVAKLLAEEFGTLDKLAQATVEDLCKIHGVGESMAHCVVEFFSRKKNVQMVAAFEKAGVNTRALTMRVKEGPLADQKFVLTGELETMTRKQAKAQLENLGATVVESVSKNTTAVVAGTKAGGKLTKAQNLGIKIYNEDEFRKLLEDET